MDHRQLRPAVKLQRVFRGLPAGSQLSRRLWWLFMGALEEIEHPRPFVAKTNKLHNFLLFSKQPSLPPSVHSYNCPFLVTQALLQITITRILEHLIHFPLYMLVYIYRYIFLPGVITYAPHCSLHCKITVNNYRSYHDRKSN